MSKRSGQNEAVGPWPHHKVGIYREKQTHFTDDNDSDRDHNRQKTIARENRGNNSTI